MPVTPGTGYLRLASMGNHIHVRIMHTHTYTQTKINIKKLKKHQIFSTKNTPKKHIYIAYNQSCDNIYGWTINTDDTP